MDKGLSGHLPIGPQDEDEDGRDGGVKAVVVVILVVVGKTVVNEEEDVGDTRVK